MKYMILSLLILATAASCSGNKNLVINLTEKGRLTADVFITDQETHRKMRPEQLYFIKLETIGQYESRRIILSDKYDDQGRIFINPEPGIYAIAVVYRNQGNQLIYAFLDEELIRLSTTEIQRGDDKVVTLNIIDYQTSLFDKAPASSKYYKSAISIPRNELVMLTIGKKAPEMKKSTQDDSKKDKGDDKKIEVIKY